MELKSALENVVIPGLKLLPKKMDTPEARAMLLAIGLQESKWIHRKQIGGPAKSFYQFEKGGGVAGVLNHPVTKPIIDNVLELIEINRAEVFDAMQYNDQLATVMARLLLWSDPNPLPNTFDGWDKAWDTYVSIWRPGKPHKDTFRDFWDKSVALVTSS